MLSTSESLSEMLFAVCSLHLYLFYLFFIFLKDIGVPQLRDRFMLIEKREIQTKRPFFDSTHFGGLETLFWHCHYVLSLQQTTPNFFTSQAFVQNPDRC